MFSLKFLWLVVLILLLTVTSIIVGIYNSPKNNPKKNYPKKNDMNINHFRKENPYQRLINNNTGNNFIHPYQSFNTTTQDKKKQNDSNIDHLRKQNAHQNFMNYKFKSVTPIKKAFESKLDLRDTSENFIKKDTEVLSQSQKSDDSAKTFSIHDSGRFITKSAKKIVGPEMSAKDFYNQVKVVTTEDFQSSLIGQTIEPLYESLEKLRNTFQKNSDLDQHNILRAHILYTEIVHLLESNESVLQTLQKISESKYFHFSDLKRSHTRDRSPCFFFYTEYTTHELQWLQKLVVRKESLFYSFLSDYYNSAKAKNQGINFINMMSKLNNFVTDKVNYIIQHPNQAADLLKLFYKPNPTFQSPLMFTLEYKPFYEGEYNNVFNKHYEESDFVKEPMIIHSYNKDFPDLYEDLRTKNVSLSLYVKAYKNHKAIIREMLKYFQKYKVNTWWRDIIDSYRKSIKPFNHENQNKYLSQEEEKLNEISIPLFQKYSSYKRRSDIISVELVDDMYQASKDQLKFNQSIRSNSLLKPKGIIKAKSMGDLSLTSYTHEPDSSLNLLKKNSLIKPKRIIKTKSMDDASLTSYSHEPDSSVSLSQKILSNRYNSMKKNQFNNLKINLLQNGKPFETLYKNSIPKYFHYFYFTQ